VESHQEGGLIEQGVRSRQRDVVFEMPQCWDLLLVYSPFSLDTPALTSSTNYLGLSGWLQECLMIGYSVRDKRAQFRSGEAS
jgi:hypothetical protein